MLRNGNSNRGERTCGAVIGHDHTFVWSPQLLKQFILFHKIVKESFVALEDLQTEGICWESVGPRQAFCWIRSSSSEGVPLLSKMAVIKRAVVRTGSEKLPTASTNNKENHLLSEENA